MKTHWQVPTLWLRAALWLLGLVATASNAAAGTSWAEEALLHDGQTMIVHRSQSYGGRAEPGQSGPIHEHTLRFRIPGSDRELEWTSEYSEDIGRMNFYPLAVHVLQGVPYVIAHPNLCLAYNKWGRPNPPYIIFKFEAGQWHRISIEALPSEFQTFNLSLGIQRNEAEAFSRHGTVSAAAIRQSNEGGSVPELKTLVREPLPKGSRNSDVNCDEMIPNGRGGWRSLDFFRRLPNRDLCLRVCVMADMQGGTCPCDQLFKAN
jgi:hypothetical protein